MKKQNRRNMLSMIAALVLVSMMPAAEWSAAAEETAPVETAAAETIPAETSAAEEVTETAEPDAPVQDTPPLSYGFADGESPDEMPVETTAATETTAAETTTTNTAETTTTNTAETTTTDTAETTTTAASETTAETTTASTETTTSADAGTEADTAAMQMVGSAVKFVPYSFLLYNPNYPTEPVVPEEETEPEIPDKTVTIPSNLTIWEKGSWGNYGGYLFNDGTLLIDSIISSSGSSLTIPNSSGSHKIRAMELDGDLLEDASPDDYWAIYRRESSLDWLKMCWGNATKVTVPRGIAFVSKSDNLKLKPLSYAEATKIFEMVGITLVIPGWSDTIPAQTTAPAPIEGRLPEGLQFNPEALEIYGVPLETGTFTFTISDIYSGTLSGADGSALPVDPDSVFELIVESNENTAVFDETDAGYSILDPIGTDAGNHDYILEAPADTLFRSEGEFGEFVNLWLNGQKLERGTDYDAESGSTKMMIYAQTFEAKANQNGVNTIAAEFRTSDINALNTLSDTNPLHVTAQNFRFKKNKPVQTPSRISNTNAASRPAASVNTGAASDKKETSAATSDNTPLHLFGMLAALSLTGSAASLLLRRKKKNK